VKQLRGLLSVRPRGLTAPASAAETQCAQWHTALQTHARNACNMQRISAAIKWKEIHTHTHTAERRGARCRNPISAAAADTHTLYALLTFGRTGVAIRPLCVELPQTATLGGAPNKNLRICYMLGCLMNEVVHVCLAANKGCCCRWVELGKAARVRRNIQLPSLSLFAMLCSAARTLLLSPKQTQQLNW
jgi:hypothetical protein